MRQWHQVDYYRTQITFKEMSTQICQELPYVTEFDLFQVHYVTQYEWRPNAVVNLCAAYNSFVTTELYHQSDTITLDQFLKYFYILAPEQGKRMLIQPNACYFYYCDDLYNENVFVDRLVGYLRCKFSSSDIS